MLPGWTIFAAAFAYLLLLFAVATYGDRKSRDPDAAGRGRPLVYALSLAIYCTSWTYFGGVGLASAHGLEFLGIYIGPILMFTLGLPLIRRIVALAKSERLTSIADFVGARYGKSPGVAAIVALIALIGAIPYIALQLKAVSSSVKVVVDFYDYDFGDSQAFVDLPLIVSLFLACFAVVFGTRHTDATEHQDGLILAISMESVVKLLALATVGIYVVYFMFDGLGDLWLRAAESAQVTSALAHETPIARWLLLIVLSAFAIVILPRQFHVTVVENRTAGELRTAGVLFPLYLIAINLFVLPVAIGGVIAFQGLGDADLYVLALPLAQGQPMLTLVSFIGGFSAATAMVIVECVALSIMISNDIVIPVVLRRNLIGRGEPHEDLTRMLLRIRRLSIFFVLLLGYAYYRFSTSSAGLASIGLLAFAAIAQVAPALIGGLVWRQANARGAIAGMVCGLVVWAYLLFLPSLGVSDNSGIAAAILGFLLPGASVLSGPQADPLVAASVLSLLVNVAAFVIGSLSRSTTNIERLQANIFIRSRPQLERAFRGSKTKVTVGDLKSVVATYLGEERTERSFHSYERQAGRWLEDSAPADIALVHFSEQVLGSAIGSSSARLVLSLTLQRIDETSADTSWLLDQASEALQYNQGMLQTALGQMDQGIAVFDSSGNLTVWNRRFRELLDLPEQVGQVGFALKDMIDILVAEGHIAAGERRAILDGVRNFGQPFQLVLSGGRRIVEVLSNAMPERGFVATFTDITERVEADRALKLANETLEMRVAERTAELTRVNRELAEARAAADEANLGKTRFFAAAGHDILQPLNAARLYSSSLVERLGDSENGALVHNIDSSLDSVEAILGAVLDISRLDTGAMKPRFQAVQLDDLLRRIETDFAPIARAKNLTLKIMPTSVAVRSDPNLLRRLVQNLVSNAIKYTNSGKVLVGVRRQGGNAAIQVHDTGIGIPSSKFRTVFKEFARLDDGARTAPGLGLGLSIVDRIARVLGHPVDLQSTLGRGTSFKVRVAIDASAAGRKGSAPGPSAPVVKPMRGLKVLCIDNEPKILEGMRLLLSGWGCEVVTADSIAAVKALLAGAQPAFHGIIADYHLGDGTGIEAIDRVRAALGAELPGLLVTADRSAEVRALAEGKDIVVQNKPVRPASMRAWLTRLANLGKEAAE